MIKGLIGKNNEQSKIQLMATRDNINKKRKGFEDHCILPCTNTFYDFKYHSSSFYHCYPAEHLHTFILGVTKTEYETTIGIWTPTSRYTFGRNCKKNI